MGIRTLHIITDLYTGGAEQALYNLLKGWFAERVESQVVSLRDEGTIGPEICSMNIHVSTLDIQKSWSSIFAFERLRKIVRAFQPDILQGWMYHGNLAATLARTFASGHPMLVWNIHDSLYDLRYEKPMTRQVIRANRFFSNFPDALIYVSQLSRKHHEVFGFASSNGQVIPNGIDVKRFYFSPMSRQRVRFELGIPDDELVVGHVARLHPMKNHSLFLRAAADLALRYPETHFLLIGQDVSMRNKIFAQLIPKEARDRFYLLGERSDVPDLMSAMDIFCQSSWSEAFPNVLCEAMAAGVPCVATDVGDSALIVGDTGVIVPPRDEQKLSTGIENLLSLSYEERRLLGKRARARIEENYTIDAIIDQYVKLYERLVEKKNSNSKKTRSVFMQ